MSDWEERDRSWKRFRGGIEVGKRGKFERRFGMR
jgi:hypothetical protein